MPFKTCTLCNAKWDDRDSFLRDNEITLSGYQVNFEELQLGFFLFNHSCETTLLIEAEHFLDLYDGPVFREKLTGTDQCPGYCLHESEFTSCPAHCECAYVREILQIVKNYKKTT